MFTELSDVATRVDLLADMDNQLEEWVGELADENSWVLLRLEDDGVVVPRATVKPWYPMNELAFYDLDGQTLTVGEAASVETDGDGNILLGAPSADLIVEIPACDLARLNRFFFDGLAPGTISIRHQECR